MCPFCDKKIDKNTSTCKNKKGDILNTELSRTLTIAEAKEQYDENCKNILSNKVILAWILRRTVKEFAVYSIDKIMECIEKPTVSKVCVNPGLTNHQKITGINKEKKKILQTDYHIPMTIRLGEELNFMCNLSDLLEEEVLNRKETEIVLKMIAQGLSDETIMECVTISKERLMQIKNSQNLNTK